MAIHRTFPRFANLARQMSVSSKKGFADCVHFGKYPAGHLSSFVSFMIFGFGKCVDFGKYLQG